MRDDILKSSYIPRQYGRLLKSLIYVLRPTICVEFGILDGYSTVVIGHTLKRLQAGGHLYTYDLFEKYPYNHAIQNRIQSRLMRFGLEAYVTVRQGDICAVSEDYKEHSIDFIHVDVSNTGDILKDFMLAWNSRVRDGGCIVFEGGSPFRDEIAWMKDYHKPKLHREVRSNVILNRDYTWAVIHPYPSILICSKNVHVSAQSQEEWAADVAPYEARQARIDEHSLKQVLKEF